MKRLDNPPLSARECTVFRVEDGAGGTLILDRFLGSCAPRKSLVWMAACVHGDLREGRGAVAKVCVQLRPDMMPGSVLAIAAANRWVSRPRSETSRLMSANRRVDLSRSTTGVLVGTPIGQGH